MEKLEGFIIIFYKDLIHKYDFAFKKSYCCYFYIKVDQNKLYFSPAFVCYLRTDPI